MEKSNTHGLVHAVSLGRAPNAEVPYTREEYLTLHQFLSFCHTHVRLNERNCVVWIFRLLDKSCQNDHYFRCSLQRSRRREDVLQLRVVNKFASSGGHARWPVAGMTTHLKSLLYPYYGIRVSFVYFRCTVAIQRFSCSLCDE